MGMLCGGTSSIAGSVVEKGLHPVRALVDGVAVSLEFAAAAVSPVVS
jgi:hypothetical protein